MTTFLLVHGSFQGGWIWQPTASVLRSAGHTVYVPTLEGCAERAHALRHGISVTSSAEELRQFLWYEDLSQVVLVGTSSGGMVAAKTAELAKDRVSRIIFVDALVPQPGESTKNIVQRSSDAEPYEVTEFTRCPTKKDLSSRLFGELMSELKEWALARATPHPHGLSDASENELEVFWSEKWPNSTVIYCVHSENPPEQHQRRTADRLLANWIELEAGHYPMLTHSEELARLLAE